jgi:hypothetical protein
VFVVRKKEETGFCMRINGNDYFIQIFKTYKTKKGDQYLIPNNPDGSHFSFHKSGQIHFKNMKTGEYNLIAKDEILGPSIQVLKEFPAQMKIIKEELNEEQLKILFRIILNILLCLKNDCLNTNCNKKGGLFIDFDKLRNMLIELSKYNEISFDEDNDEDNEDDFMMKNPISLIMEEQGYSSNIDFKKCKKCGNKPLIYKYRGKTKVKQCNFCGGFGIDINSLVKYRCNY